MYKKLLLIAILFVCHIWWNISHAYTAGVVHKLFTAENSDLPSNVVYRLICDDYGYIWMATEDGLVRYNGKNFERIKLPFSDNEIINIYKQKDYLYLFNLTRQVAKINLRNYKLINTIAVNEWLRSGNREYDPISAALKIKDTFYFSDMRVRTKAKTISIDGENFCSITREDLWNKLQSALKTESNFPTTSSIFNNGYMKIYALQFFENAMIYENNIYSINDGKIERFFNGNTYGLEGTVMAYTRNGDDLYVGYYQKNGLVKIENFYNNAKIKKVVTIIPEKKILSIVKDRSNNLWISIHKSGVMLIPANAKQIKQYNKQNFNLYNDDINYLQYYDNDVYIGYREGKIDRKQGDNIVAIPITLPKYNHDFRYIIVEKQQWKIFTADASFLFSAKSNSSVPYFKLIASNEIPFKDVNSTAKGYVASTKSKYYLVNKEEWPGTTTFLPIPSMSVTLTAKGRVICASIKGLYIDNKIVKGTENERFNIARYFNGDIVACSRSAMFVIRNDTVTKVFTPQNGLLGSTFTDVQYSKSDNCYYVKSEIGLTIIDKKDLQILKIFNGKNFIDPIRINCFALAEHYVTLGTNKGIFEIDKAYFHDNNYVPPCYLIATNAAPSHNYFDTSASMVYQTNMSVNYRLDLLEFEPAAHLVWYTITNNQKTVIDSTAVTDYQLQFNPTKPGMYTITVYASSPQNKWKVRKTFSLQILPLWHQTFLFRFIVFSFALISLGLVVRYFYKRNLKKEKEKYESRNKVLDLESKALFAQMKPHFVFNALNPLQSFILENDKEQALNYLEKFALLIRELLNQSREKYSTIASEISFIERYLFVAQTRFDGHFIYSITNDANANLLIPTMMLQPLVENAIEHGVKNLKEGVIAIDIKERADGDFLEICVTDNGAGFTDKDYMKANHALNIITERLQIIKKETGTGTISFTKNKLTNNTEVTILLPILKK